MQRGFGYQNRRNAALFSPLSLFTGGVQGAWYDPSDSTTLFTDRAGTTPCGTPGGGSVVPVGRMLDKSGNGNHATAANDTTARPELRARVNLLTFSEQFDNAAWTKSNATVTANAALAPNGTTTADKVISTGVTGGILQTFTGTSFANTASIVDLRTGVVTSNVIGTWSSFVVSDAGNSWWRISAVLQGQTISIYAKEAEWRYILVQGFSNSVYFYPAQTATATGTGNSVDGIFIWGAQLTATNEFPANTYQRIVDANTYDSTGFPRYLVANGTSSAMSTPGNVNLSGTDKVTVFAGVRKLSTGPSTGFIAETSAAAESNNGAFRIGVDSGGFEYFISSRGTVSQQVNVDNAAYLPPVSNVVQSSFDIAAPSVSVRLNGVAVGTNTSSQGTGNFGTYPLFIGSRNNASFFFNGNIYSLIVVGSAVSAGNITSTEQWVAGKTGITI